MLSYATILLCVVGAFAMVWPAGHDRWTSVPTAPLSVWCLPSVALLSELVVFFAVPFILIAITALLVRGDRLASKWTFIGAFTAMSLGMGVYFAPLPPEYAELGDVLRVACLTFLEYPLGVTLIVVGYRAWERQC